jgi:DNA-directed RNA polymerase subunit RPC12/RpoP
MSIEFACNTEATATKEFGRPRCPRCGSVLLMAEEAAFNLRGRIRNAWSCDDCSHEFVTSIRLWPLAA